MMRKPSIAHSQIGQGCPNLCAACMTAPDTSCPEVRKHAARHMMYLQAPSLGMHQASRAAGGLYIACNRLVKDLRYSPPPPPPPPPPPLLTHGRDMSYLKTCRLQQCLYTLLYGQKASLSRDETVVGQAVPSPDPGVRGQVHAACCDCPSCNHPAAEGYKLRHSAAKESDASRGPGPAVHSGFLGTQ